MKVIFAGGATGGHLFPGIAAAEALRERGAKVLFLCSSRPFDARELRRANFDFAPQPAVGLSLKRLPGTVLGGLRALRVAARAVSNFRPDLIVGLGGHPSAAALAVAAVRGIPYVLLEQNSIPGKVTRLFARGARRIYAQWEFTRRYLGSRAVAIGSPLRSSLAPLDREEARRALGIPAGKTVITILGGSQGAHRLNLAILGGASELNGESASLHLLHQTGPADREQAEIHYRSRGVSARVFDFEPRMDRVYAASDLVVCRAGALTLQELSFFRVPAVLVPLPTSADGHQQRNAELLARAGCALVRDEAALHAGFLRELLLSYRSSHEGFLQRGQRFARFFRHDGRDLFAADVLGWG